MPSFANSKHTTFLLPALCTVVTVVVVGFVIYPWFNEIRWMKSEITKNEVLLIDKLEPKSELLTSLSEEVLDTSILALEEALPSFPQEWAAFAALEALAGESQVELGTLSVAVAGAKTTAAQSQSYGVQIPILVDGDTSQIVAFLKNTERAKRVLSLDNLEIDSDKDKLHLSAGVNFPYLPVPETLGTVEEKLAGLQAGDKEVLAQISQLNLYGVSLKQFEPTEGSIGVGKEELF